MIDLLENQVAGLTAKLQGLRERKDLFLKAQGMEEEVARARVRIQGFATEIATEEAVLADLNRQKNEVVGGVCDKIADTMSAVLPYGKAIFKIDGESLFVGWEIEGRGVIPYEGLSGGQEVAFKPALGYVLAGSSDKIVIIEAAEMDTSALAKMLGHLSENTPADTQIVINTCHYPDPDSIPGNWEVTRL